MSLVWGFSGMGKTGCSRTKLPRGRGSRPRLILIRAVSREIVLPAGSEARFLSQAAIWNSGSSAVVAAICSSSRSKVLMSLAISLSARSFLPGEAPTSGNARRMNSRTSLSLVAGGMFDKWATEDHPAVVECQMASDFVSLRVLDVV